MNNTIIYLFAALADIGWVTTLPDEEKWVALLLAGVAAIIAAYEAMQNV
jgi:hypothetical protein